MNNFDNHKTAPIEQFPHVAEKLELLWGYPEFLNYMRELQQTTRTFRQGFPVEVFEELSFLRSLYLNQMKLVSRESLSDSQILDLNKLLKKNDVWDQNFAK